MSAPLVDKKATPDRLIKAAFVVVARDGFDGASVKAIAAEAGVNAGLLHYHFASKEALFEAALRQSLGDYLARVRARVAKAPPDQQLVAMFADAHDAATHDADFFRLRLAFCARALSDPALAKVVRELNGEAVAENARSFAAQRGAPEPSARDRHLASTLKAAFDGIMLAKLLDPEFSMDAAAAILAPAAAAWLATECS